MTFRYQDIGERLHAYRIGARLSVDEVAARLGVSRTALYRYEKGEVIKLETLARLSELLGVSIPSLLGVGVEYTDNAVGFFERVRQIEERAFQSIVLFGPSSFTLTSDAYDTVLEAALREGLPTTVSGEQVDELMKVLRRRKQNYRSRRPNVVNIITTSEVQRFLRDGLVGNRFIGEAVREERRRQAREEVEHILGFFEQPPMGVEFAIVEDALPITSFQILREPDTTYVLVSPFRLGTQPNIAVGVAMITSAPEAIELHSKVVDELWSRAHKGIDGARVIQDLLDRSKNAD